LRDRRHHHHGGTRTLGRHTRAGRRILARAAAACGSVQIRNMATLGGNLANGSPAADTATPLLALDAEVVLVDAGDWRKLPLTEFYSVLKRPRR